jgi:predicted nucleic acid-binding protein
MDSLENNVLQAMDSTHIGSALAMECDVFATADQRQLDEAKLAGLSVEAV